MHERTDRDAGRAHVVEAAAEWPGDGAARLRVSFATSMARLETGPDRLEAGIAAY
jgi:hypothetical protein